MPLPLFRIEQERFIPSDDARSPWGPAVLHGGPVAGLLARAAERASSPDLTLARLTVDLYRPVPQEPLDVRTRIVRTGARIQMLDVSIIARDIEVARASAMFLRSDPIHVEPRHLPPAVAHPGPEGLATQTLIEASRGTDFDPETYSDRWGFHCVAQARKIFIDHDAAHGIAWLHLPADLVEGEANTPLVRVATLSDFCSGLSMVRIDPSTSFINTDITLYLGRLPEGEWICFDAQGSALPSGIGLGQATVSDAGGAIGNITVARLVNRRANP